MKIDLPLETWTDVFGFLPRSLLVAFCPHIHDRQFASFIQFSLHKCGQITLGNLHIKTSPNDNGPIVVLQNNQELPLAEGPIPSIVMNFNGIHLSNFDSRVVEFMQELQRNSLLENVNLIFENCSDNLLAFLITIMPLISSIDSIKIFDYHSNRNFYSRGGKRMLEFTRVLKIWEYLSHDWYWEWLYSARQDGKPRLLVIYINDSRSMSAFIEKIKKDFLSSKQAISFFIRPYTFAPNVQQDLKNEETSEKLKFEIIDIDRNEMLISRHPIGANEEWIKEMSKIPNDEYRNIIIS